MGLKSKIRTHTETTEATLTTRGREILSREGKIDATKYAFSDEEIDYTLWWKDHPSESENAPFKLIMDTPMLEATPHRTKFNSYLLPDETHKKYEGSMTYTDWRLPEQALYQINIGTTHNPRASWESSGIAIEPTTTHRPIRVIKNEEDDSKNYYTRLDPPVEFSEQYIFTIENTNVVYFSMYLLGPRETNDWIHDIPGSGDVVQAKVIAYKVNRLQTKAATTITVQGVTSGITQVCSIVSIPDEDSKVFAGASPVDVTDPKFY
jgi:hypothetical protein